MACAYLKGGDASCNLPSKYIVHTIAVGFHHRRGSIIEAAYPPFGDDSPPDYSNVPPVWKCLSALSLPDGAHKFLKDSIYFTLPSIEKENSTVFGVASYHQVQSAAYSKATPDVTRNTVLKSLVVLSRVPLFTFIAHQLSVMVESLFRDPAGFTLANLQRCHFAVEGMIASVMREPSTYREVLYRDLHVENLFRVYGRDALVLCKAVLLERRILFDGDSAGCLCHWILILLSLFPGVLDSGLTRSAAVDPTWVQEASCHCVNDSPAPSPGGSRSATTPTNAARKNSEGQRQGLRQPTLHRQATDDSRLLQRNDAFVMELRSILPVKSDGLLRPSSLRHVAIELGREAGEDLSVPGTCQRRPSPVLRLDAPFPTDNWGFPLALFTKSNLLPIYLTLYHMDTFLESVESHTVGGDPQRCVRGFLACATNPLLRSHRHLADLVVTGLPLPSGPPPLLHGATGGTSDVDLASLTVLFDDTVTRKSSSSNPGSNLLRLEPTPTGGSSGNSEAPKSGQSAIRITASASSNRNDSPTDFRALSLPVNQALQLTRCDRQFADELQRVSALWYSSAQALNELASCAKSDDLSAYIDKLSTGQQEILRRFPTCVCLTAWIRRQVVCYLRAALLTADGHGDSASDFGSAFITCLRASRVFLVWRSQYVPSEIFQVSGPYPASTSSSSMSTMISQCPPAPQTRSPGEVGGPAVPLASSLFNEEASGRQAGKRPPDSEAEDQPMSRLLTQHPGRRYTDSAEWDQTVVGFRRFGNLAADHGRRLVIQGMAGLSRLTNDPSSNPRTGQVTGSRWVMSRISDAFKNLLVVTPARGEQSTPP